jgi:hypothetical protein
MQHRSSDISRHLSRHLKHAGCAAIVLSSFCLPETGWAQATLPTCPVPTANVSSSQVPVDVAVGCTLPPGNPIAFFDDFSWRIFLALVWPAANGQRGVPDNSKTFQNGVPLVFQTYKADWESFPNGSSNPPSPIPTAWSSFAGAQNPCPNEVSNAGWGDLIRGVPGRAADRAARRDRLQAELCQVSSGL